MENFREILGVLITANRVDSFSLVNDDGCAFISLMHEILSDYDDEDVKKGVMNYIKSEDSKYDYGRLPQIGTLITHINLFSTKNKEELKLK